MIAKIWIGIGTFVLIFALALLIGHVRGTDMQDRWDSHGVVLHAAHGTLERAEVTFESLRLVCETPASQRKPAHVDWSVAQGRKAARALQQLASALPADLGMSPEAQAAADAVDHYVNSVCLAPSGSSSPDLSAVGVATEQRLARLNAQLHRVSDSEFSRLHGVLPGLRWFYFFTFFISLIIAGLITGYLVDRRILRPMHRAQSRLAQERNLLRILFENIPDCIYFKTAESRFIRVNKAQREMFGVESDAEIVGRTEFDFMPEASAKLAYEEEQEMLRTNEPVVSRIEQIDGPTGRRWMTSTKVPVLESGEEVRIVGISRDVSAWMEAVDALEESERSFRTLFSLIPHPVWVYDAKTFRILELNQAAINTYGYSEDDLRGKVVTELYAADDADRLRQETLANPDKPPAGNWKHVTSEGRVIDVQVVANALEFLQRKAVLAVIEDVTDRHRLEVELQQAQRLEVVGQLAAGIAHEINTPIQYIGDNLRFVSDTFITRQFIFGAFAELLEACRTAGTHPDLVADVDRANEDYDSDYLAVEIPNALSQSLDGVERVATIVRAMKEFAHPGKAEKAAADLNHALSNALIVSRNEVKYVADVIADYGEIPPVLCLIGELNQVLLNLLVNAADAIREVNKDGAERGTITVKTWREGDQAVISISDTGCGVPPEIRSRIFDPFFTTKEVGQGSGQGLAIARSIIVDKHHGSLRHVPNTPRGATFIISLPIRPPASVTELSGDEELIGVAPARKIA